MEWTLKSFVATLGELLDATLRLCGAPPARHSPHEDVQQAQRYLGAGAPNHCCLTFSERAFREHTWEPNEDTPEGRGPVPPSVEADSAAAMAGGTEYGSTAGDVVVTDAAASDGDGGGGGVSTAGDAPVKSKAHETDRVCSRCMGKARVQKSEH